ncbi:hypothetical protein N7466_003067 [Penicillium verhagenii]|uniref:uncharacterized protein n=1 Tax=Penicillium verhagenii TaxID=1562060 RepID=UPI0025453380|nr:uncharacterized protein N7466_003067 [Penicillium verhagenii]KAJ5936617.1 hypothetical protein N7466_003067 [Penicillium verhagenii]
MFPSTPDLSSQASSQLLSPPPSPRTRRRILKNSGDVDGKISLERYNLASDPYRSTSLRDPPPYPLCITPSDELADTIRPFAPEIYQILRDHNFPSSTSVEYSTFSKPGHPGWELEKFILRVVVEENHHSQVQFGPTKDEVMKLLEDKGLTEIQVEIINPDLHYTPSWFYVGKDAPLVRAFERARGDIIILLQHEIPQRWRVVSPFNVGNVQSKSESAIVVLVDPLTEANWSRIRKGIKSLVDGVDTDFDVEFLPGELRFL